MNKPVFDFFVWCSGADPELLAQCSRKEQIKYAGLGSLVLIPAILGLASMSYAISTLTDMPVLPILMALVWAAIVFAIDRFIVSTFRKGRSVLRDFFSFQFFARLLFAVGIGILVSHPLVLLVFKDSLTQELLVMRDEQDKKLFERYEGQIDSVRGRNDQLALGVRAKEQERREWQQFLAFEISGKDTVMACCGSTTGMRYYGPATRKIEDRIATLGQEIDALKTDIRQETEANQQVLANLSAQRDTTQATFQSAFSFDYVAREVALERLEAREPGGQSVRLTKWFLMLFFIFVDILPVFLKMATVRGEYDDRLDAEKLVIHLPYGYEREQNEKVRRSFVDRLTQLRLTEIERLFTQWDGADFNRLLRRLAPFLSPKNPENTAKSKAEEPESLEV
jgi:hypothetical protein